MWKYKDFKFENIRKVLKGHWVGAIMGGVLGYALYKYFGNNITFAVSPLEKAVDYVKATDAKSVIVISMIVALGMFLGAFIQARGRY